MMSNQETKTVVLYELDLDSISLGSLVIYHLKTENDRIMNQKTCLIHRTFSTFFNS